MTRCQSELDPVVDARCDARRRRDWVVASKRETDTACS